MLNTILSIFLILIIGLIFAFFFIKNNAINSPTNERYILKDLKAILKSQAWCLTLYCERNVKYINRINHNSQWDRKDLNEALEWLRERNNSFADLAFVNTLVAKELLEKRTQMLDEICQNKDKINELTQEIMDINEKLSLLIEDSDGKRLKLRELFNKQISAVISSISSRNKMYFAECRKQDKIVKKTGVEIYEQLNS